MAYIGQYPNLGTSGYSGYSGVSGWSGISGYSGYSGISGYSGSGVSGYSGISGWSGISGYSGYSGISGYSGSGVSGYSGISGWSGISGYSGYSGVSGWSGISGYSGSGVSGYSGYSGISGYSGSGVSGYSGISGWSGISGYSGYSGVSGWSGISGYSGSGVSGYSGYSGISGYSGVSAGGEFTLSASQGTIYSSEAGSTSTGSNNFFAGYQAGCANTTGAYNNFFGGYAGYFNTTGSRNNFLGTYAGQYNTTGSYNNFFGYNAGYCNTTGWGNNFLGPSAGRNNTDGHDNNFFGASAGYCNISGDYNNFLGYRAGFNNTGTYNTFIGTWVGECNTYGGENNFIGVNAGKCNTSGWANNFFGTGAGTCNTTGCYNNFLGALAGKCNTTGSYNNILGYLAGYGNTSGNFNNFIGNCAGCAVTTGSNNTIIGGAYGVADLSNTVILAAGTTERLKVDATGLYINGSEFTGGGGGEFTLSASQGTIYSSEAGSTSTGSNNFFAGYQAGCANTTGAYNNFFGGYAGRSNTTGFFNNFLGPYAGFCNTTSSYNNFFGGYAGYNNTTGSSNIFFGYQAGYFNTTGSNNTIIGSAYGTSALADTVILAAGTTERLKVDSTGLYINGSEFTGGGGGSEIQAVASGNLSNGDKVIVNTDGTVSVVAETPVPTSAGPEIVFNSGTTYDISSTYDSVNSKVVIAFRDGANSNYGTAVVGTVSGTSISFGSESVFNSGATYQISSTYDSANGKVVIAYRDGGDYNRGRAVVGTVSGTSISFGYEYLFNYGTTYDISSTYDSVNSKVVIAFRDGANSNYGTAVVGTVSGTSISFGSESVFNSGTTYNTSCTYDSANSKVVIAYQDAGNSGYGTAVVGTVSGTSISFGSEVVLNSGTTQNFSSTYDSANGKVVIAYQDISNSGYATAVVGTVSGTSISFGSKYVFYSGGTYTTSCTYDSANGKVVIAYQKYTESLFTADPGAAVVGTVSGTSISFGSEIVFNSGTTLNLSSTYDSANGKVVIAYQDAGNSNYGTAVIFEVEHIAANLTSDNYIGISDDNYNNGETATIQVIGGANDAQTGLTAGYKYYVQRDGTLSTTPGDPSVVAGVALSSTKLLIK